ncbi:hypothetical protein ABPG73_022344 [Tetrahymena malaccensis]
MNKLIQVPKEARIKILMFLDLIKNDRIYFEKSNLKKQIGEEHEEVNNLQSITVPSIMVKSNQISNNTSQSNLNNFIKYEKAQDEIIQFKKPAFELKTTDGNDNDYLIKERVLQSNFIANERFLSPRSGSPSVLDSSRYFSRFKAESSLQASKLSPIKSVRLQRKITLGISQTKVNNQQNQPSQVVESQLPNKDKVLLFQKEVIEKLKKKEINEYFAKKLEIIQSQKVSKSIKNMIFGNKLWKKKDERNDQELDISLKEIIESHISKKKSSQPCTQEIRRKNYFEEQFAISLSQELKAKYIQKFLDKCTKDSELSEVDYRILSSVIRNKIN